MTHSHFSTIEDKHSVITAINSGVTFPEFVSHRADSYREDITLFSTLIADSDSSAELLEKIRNPKSYGKDTRMSLLKLFRRCVSTVCDTEATKKVRTPTSTFVDNFGDTFKDIDLLKEQFADLPESHFYALSSLLGEYDSRGEQGYILTDMFFDWVEEFYNGELTIEGPRGAGKDIQLSEVFPAFNGDYPCDFVIKKADDTVLAVGFARYDSTRGGAQSDDRTGGNDNKVTKAQEFMRESGESFKIVFLSEGPGLVHRDTWEEACTLDGKLDGKVRVTTLKLAEERLSQEWLES
ncbi:hypothetical protein [Vibrio coralliirubri]|uniref:hypothetical protein n=1 Tax=Vibrio coralliirubri TaxID=1516159 RepID=UPI00063A20E7|nr:hypothetical protein [Vibrio coralliirubri]CDT47946.1 conserved hypothetical protein [Vibrio coralliirubri]